MTVRNGMRPIHPGEIIREEYLVPMELSANALAQGLGVPPNRVSLILRELRGVTADTTLRLARYFDTTPEFWMNLQAAYDLRVAEAERGKAIRQVKKYAAAKKVAASRTKAPLKTAAMAKPGRRLRVSPAAAGSKPGASRRSSR